MLCLPEAAADAFVAVVEHGLTLCDMPEPTLHTAEFSINLLSPLDSSRKGNTGGAGCAVRAKKAVLSHVAWKHNLLNEEISTKLTTLP